MFYWNTATFIHLHIVCGCLCRVGQVWDYIAYKPKTFTIFVVVQLLSHIWLFAIPWTVARQPSLSFTISQHLLKLTFIESVMPSNHFILCRPLLLPSIFSSIRVFSNESGLLLSCPFYKNVASHWSKDISGVWKYLSLISYLIVFPGTFTLITFIFTPSLWVE